ELQPVKMMVAGELAKVELVLLVGEFFVAYRSLQLFGDARSARDFIATVTIDQGAETEVMGGRQLVAGGEYASEPRFERASIELEIVGDLRHRIRDVAGLNELPLRLIANRPVLGPIVDGQPGAERPPPVADLECSIEVE